MLVHESMPGGRSENSGSECLNAKTAVDRNVGDFELCWLRFCRLAGGDRLFRATAVVLEGTAIFFN